MTTDPLPAPSYVVVDGLGGPWLAIEVQHHTCGTGSGGHYGAHEPGCGLEPVARVEQLLDQAQVGARLADASPQVLDVIQDHRRVNNVRRCSGHGCAWRPVAAGRNGDPDAMLARHRQFNEHLANLIVRSLAGC